MQRSSASSSNLRGGWYLVLMGLSMLALQTYAFTSPMLTPSVIGVRPTLTNQGGIAGDSIKQSSRVTRNLGVLNAIQVSRVTNTGAAEEITDFFVTNFWDQPITKAKQKQQLMFEVYKDLTTRYIGAKSGKSALLVAKEAGRIVACVGIETRTIRDGQVTKLEPNKVANAPGTKLGPVIANLAVDRSIRRKGIGAKILVECEKVAKGWGYDELWLVVDQNNKPAKTLYEKVGFEIVTKDPKGTKVVPTEWQLRELPVTNLCMRKTIKVSAQPFSFLGGLFGR